MKQSADKLIQTHLETDDHSSPTVLEITFVSILVAIVKISFIYFFNIFWKYQKALAIFLSEFIPSHDPHVAAVLEITLTNDNVTILSILVTIFWNWFLSSTSLMIKWQII